MADIVNISAIARVIDQASGPLKAIQGAISRVGDTAKQVTGVMANLAGANAFRNLGSSLGNVGGAVTRLAGHFRALASPIGALVGFGGLAGAISTMREYISTTAQLGRVSRRTGASVETLQAFRLMAGDADLADLALNRIQRTMGVIAGGGKAGAKMLALFNRFKISLDDIKSGNFDKILANLADGFAKQQSPATLAQIGTAIFGRSWAEIAPILQKGSGALEEARKKVAELGGATAAQVAEAEAARTALRNMDEATRGLKNQIAAALLPALTPLITATKEWIVANRPEIVTGVTKAVTALGRGLGLLWQGIQWVVGVMGGWGNAAIVLAAILGRNVLKSVGNLALEFGKLALNVVKALPAFTLIGGAAIGAATIIRRNWGTIGPWLARQLENITGISGEQWGQIATIARASFNNIVKAWKSGGIAGAVYQAGLEIYNNWNVISEFLQQSFPEITRVAKQAWNDIEKWAKTSYNNIKQAWETGGLGAALDATWEALKIGGVGAFQFVRDEAAKINWEKIGTDLGNSVKTSAIAVMDFTDWLRSLPWETVGTWIGEKIGDFLLIELGGDHPEWVDAVINAFADIADAAFEIGERIAVSIGEGIISKLGGEKAIQWLRAFDEGANKISQSVTNAGKATNRFGRAILGLPEAPAEEYGPPIPRRLRIQRPPRVPTPPTVPGVAEAEAAARETAEIIPFRRREPTPPLAPPIGPQVAQPGLLAQAREAQVRIDGEISQRLRVDMSPDLRAMLVEQRAQIADLRTRQQVEIGQSMAPALGLA